MSQYGMQGALRVNHKTIKLKYFASASVSEIYNAASDEFIPIKSTIFIHA